jgi:hypothetical protein
MTRTTDKRRLTLTLDATVDEGSHGFPTYLKVTARLGELVHLDGADRLRNLVGVEDLEGLTVSAQGSPADGGSTYGWKVEFQDVAYIDLRHAQAMARTLGRVERRLARMADELGWPESFGAYLLRVAKVLGVKEFAVWRRRPRRLHDDGDLGVLPATAAAAWLETAERTFYAEHPPVARDRPEEPRPAEGGAPSLRPCRVSC